MGDIFLEVGVLIILSAFLSYILSILKQPSILAYILTGIVLGPMGISLIQDQGVISAFSEFGILFLLFIVGLQLDLKKLKEMGKASLVIGLSQVFFTAALGFFILKIWFDNITSLYLAIGLALSSTIIVIKILSDKNEINTLHGRLSIGILLVQDFAAISVLILFSAYAKNIPLEQALSLALLKTILLVFVSFFLAWFVVPPLFKNFARSREVLFLASIAWCFLFAFVAVKLGFSVMIGAFLAGITLASNPYSFDIGGRIEPLRDFFVTIFFVSMGLQITSDIVIRYIVPILILSLFVLVGNPIILYLLIRPFKYTRETSLAVSLSLAQVSEFSLVIIVLGSSLGYIDKGIISFIAVIAAVTIGLSSYFMTFERGIIKFFKNVLGLKEEKIPDELKFYPYKRYNTVLCGYNRIGYSVLERFKKSKRKVLVVDFNPEVIKKLVSFGIPCIYGNISDEHIMRKMNLKHINMLISTVPDISANSILVKSLRSKNNKATAIISANNIGEALRLYDLGVDYVVLPHFLGGEHLSLMVERFNKNPAMIKKNKLKHITELKKRKEMGHEHPKHK